jgi:flavin-binding protein dodecin
MPVLKVIEIMGDSSKSWEDAATEAVTEAAKTVHGIKSVWIQDQSAIVANGKITRYRVTCKITFEVEGRPKARGR